MSSDVKTPTSAPVTSDAASSSAGDASHSKDPSTTSPSGPNGNAKKTPSSRPSSLTKTSPSPVTKKVKHAFWVSLINVLLPCSSSKAASRAHPIELDDPNAPGGKTGKAPAAVGERGADKPGDSKKASSEPDQKDKSPSASSPEASSSSKSGATSADSPAPTTPLKGKPAPPNLTVPAINTTPAPVEQNGDVTLVVPPSPHSHLLPRDETEGVTSGAVQPPGSTGGESRLLPPPPHTAGSGGTITSSDYSSSEDATFTTDIDAEGGDAEVAAGPPGEIDVEDEDDEEERLILQGGTGIPIGPDGQPCPLLPPVAPAHKGRKCLVLDLDETLLHSSFKLIPQADYVVPVEIEWQWHNVYVIKRPGVDSFLKKMGELYEIVIFTASLSKYADPVLDKLDVHKVVAHRLFRESCYNHKGNYVKDLSRLGRPVEDMIILDNSPASYIFHPNNAVPVSSWFNDPHDTELTDLCPFLADLMSVEDVRGVLDGGL
ncbi:hypothetical protein FRB99_008509 [Tulasnella sp. 403]|nr:hypothetical protein FRB99_008509 [Tulasnella sp. 403]